MNFAVLVNVIIVGKRLSKEMISIIFTCSRISHKYTVNILSGCLCVVVFTRALLEVSKNAVVVNNDGAKYPSQLPTETAFYILNKIIDILIWKKFAVLELYGIEALL